MLLDACAPELKLVLPLALRVKIMPGTMSANSRKLREASGSWLIWRSETVLPTCEVRLSSSAEPTTCTVDNVCADDGAGAACACARFNVAVEATDNVTVRAVPGPASTCQVPGGRLTRMYVPARWPSRCALGRWRCCAR